MKISHVIRGDDHKINTFKQKQIYEAMKWDIPQFAHIPLIHSEKGSKLSKRDKSSTIDDYVKIGVLPDALRNYLLRLGWAYKDKEIFSLDESIKLFDLNGVGKSPSKLDMSRILSLNEHYIKNMDEKILFGFLKKYAQNYKKSISSSKEETIIKSLNFLKNKAKTLDDIYQNSQYILNEDIKIAAEDIKLIDANSKKIIDEFLGEFKNMSSPNKEGLEKLVNSLINKHKTNFKGVGQPLRIALVGSRFGPGIYNIILSLTKDEVVKRISKIN